MANAFAVYPCWPVWRRYSDDAWLVGWRPFWKRFDGATSTKAPPPPPADPEPPQPEDDQVPQRDDRGDAVEALQGQAACLGYWVGPVDGVYGRLTEQAVMAFQKIEGLYVDGVAGPSTRSALDTASRPRPRSMSGDRIEIDTQRQILLVVQGGTVEWAINTSTGTEQPYRLKGRTELADTPEGRWTVGRVVNGYDVGPLGALYRPRYFHHDGIAVHGYRSVPAHPASHGCVRVREAAVDLIWANDLMPVGSEVWGARRGGGG